MTDAGHAVIARAKADGAWTILDSVEALGTGAKKQVLWSVVSAKGAETRAARINRIVERAELGEPLI